MAYSHISTLNTICIAQLLYENKLAEWNYLKIIIFVGENLCLVVAESKMVFLTGNNERFTMYDI